MSSSKSSHKRRRDSDEEHERKSGHSKSRNPQIPSKIKKKKKTAVNCSHRCLLIAGIDEDDYFEKSTEFRLWLKEYKHKYFDELSSKDARYYFKKFVRKWNDQDLDGI